MPARVPTPPRRKGESQKAHAALCDYARMGAARSLAKLADRYRQSDGKASVPTRHLRYLETWSSKHAWQARVAEYDEAMQAVADEEAEREMLTGLALPRERVRFLKGILDDVLAEQVRGLLVTSPAAVAQIRGMLDDLAKETGGRKAGLDVTSGGKELATGVVFTAPGGPTE